MTDAKMKGQPMDKYLKALETISDILESRSPDKSKLDAIAEAIDEVNI